MDLFSICRHHQELCCGQQAECHLASGQGDQGESHGGGKAERGVCSDPVIRNHQASGHLVHSPSQFPRNTAGDKEGAFMQSELGCAHPSSRRRGGGY